MKSQLRFSFAIVPISNRTLEQKVFGHVFGTKDLDCLIVPFVVFPGLLRMAGINEFGIGVSEMAELGFRHRGYRR